MNPSSHLLFIASRFLDMCRQFTKKLGKAKEHPIAERKSMYAEHKVREVVSSGKNLPIRRLMTFGLMAGPHVDTTSACLWMREFAWPVVVTEILQCIINMVDVLRKYLSGKS